MEHNSDISYNINDKNYEKVTSVGQWFLTIVLLLIPIVNVVFFIIWVFGGGNNKNRTNYMRAMILPAVVMLVLYLLLGFTETGLNLLRSFVNSRQLIQTVITAVSL